MENIHVLSLKIYLLSNYQTHTWSQLKIGDWRYDLIINALVL